MTTNTDTSDPNIRDTYIQNGVDASTAAAIGRNDAFYGRPSAVQQTIETHDLAQIRQDAYAAQKALDEANKNG